MKKLLFFLFFTQSLIAQVQILPNSIGIGTGINSSIPFHINKNGEVARFQGLNPFLSFYNLNSYSGYIQGTVNGVSIGTPDNTKNIEFSTNFTPRLIINGSNGQITATEKFNANSGLRLTGPLEVEGESSGTDGMVLTSRGNATPAWVDQRVGFQAYFTNTQTFPAGFALTMLNFTEIFDNGNGFNNTTGVFTVPSSGLYEFNIYLPLTNEAPNILNAHSTIDLLVNNVVKQRKQFNFNKYSSWANHYESNFFIKLNQGEQVKFMLLFEQTNGYDISVSGSFAEYRTISGIKLY